MERSRVEEGTSDAPAPAPAPAAPTAAAVPAVLTPATALALQRTIGNANVVRIARKLAASSAIQTTYDAWVTQKAQTLKLPKTDARVRQAAEAETMARVGSLNYWKWWNEREEAAEAKAEAEAKAKADAEAAEKARLAAIEEFGPGSAFRDYEKLNKQATAINFAVVQVEHVTQKLSSPEGIKGYAYRAGAAGHGLMWGVGVESLKYAKDKQNPLQQGAEALMGTKPGPTIKEKAGEVLQTGGTSIDLLTGKLSDYYQQTRPAYNRYQAALKAFGEARDAFSQHTGSEVARLSHLGAMRTALEAMKSSAAEYKAKCELLGIQEEAKKLDKLGKAIQQGWVSGAELAVDQLGGVFVPEGGEVAKTLTKELVDVGKDMAREGAIETAKAGVKKATE